MFNLISYLCLAYVELEPTYPCADYKPGEDDLQNFDMIRKFQLDVNLDGYPGVTRVRGSNRMQTAYRIDTTANLKMPTVRVFDQGMFKTFCSFLKEKNLKKMIL